MKTLHALRHWLGLLLLLCVVNGIGANAYAVDFELVDIKINELPLTVELANTPARRAQGLMHREHAKPGMLFLYPSPQKTAFWMRNTLIPLDLAYIDARGEIVAIIQMQAMDDTTHPSPQAIIGALEMELNWFSQKGVKVGDSIQFNTTVVRGE